LPIIKTKRSELVIYVPEWKETLQKAKDMFGSWLASWLGFDCIFGKRENEICKLIRKNIWVQEGYLYVRFFVGKKKYRTATIDQMPYTKRKTLKHYATPYILEYLEEYDKTINNLDGYIYPFPREAKTKTVHTTFINREGKEETRSYTYRKEGGYRSPEDFYYYVKKVNPNIWPHLGRHTVATLAAEEGATEYDITQILDVSARTASKYVHHGTKLTEKWSEKTA